MIETFVIPTLKTNSAFYLTKQMALERKVPLRHVSKVSSKLDASSTLQNKM